MEVVGVDHKEEGNEKRKSKFTKNAICVGSIVGLVGCLFAGAPIIGVAVLVVGIVVESIVND